jgi:hypothetical protein
LAALIVKVLNRMSEPLIAKAREMTGRNLKAKKK